MLQTTDSHIAFAGDKLLVNGTLAQVALAVRHAIDGGEARPITVMDALTAQVVDLDLRGTDAEIAERLVPAVDGHVPGAAVAVRSNGPGRPRLGVVSREVSLLPRHWAWLNARRGGASATLRRLVDEARRDSADRDRLAAAQEAVDRYLRVMAGDRPHYEEVLRAFYADRDADLRRHSALWPADVRTHLQVLLERCRESQSA